MTIQGVNPAAPPAGSDNQSDDSTSLDDQMRAQSTDPGSDPSDGTDGTTDPSFELLYEFLTDNIANLNNPAVVADFIRKMRSLKNDDGTTVYRSFADMTATGALLKQKMTDDGLDPGNFFTQLNGRLFGLDMFYQQFMKDTFSPDDNLQDDPFQEDV
jgi:hypothetical protein